MQYLGKSPDARPEHFSEICRRLGLDADAIEPDMTFEEPLAFLRAYVASDGFDESRLEDLADRHLSKDQFPYTLSERLHRPWTLDDLPMMASWLKDNAPALDLIGRAVHRPAFHIPMVRQNEEQLLIMMLLPEITYARSIARGLSARANYRIATGDIDGAIDDIITCKRLGRHLGHGATVVGSLAGTALEGVADAIGVAGSLEHRPGKELLQRLVDEFEDLPPEVDLEQNLLFERFSALDSIQSLSKSGNVARELFNIDLPLSLPLDWNIVARRFNEHFDRVATTGNEAPEVSFKPSAVVSRRARSEQIGDAFGNLFLPTLGPMREARRRSMCVRQLNRITLAMLLYERDHGTLPPAFTVDVGGAPLHSWRVLLLPYLGQQSLYDQIRLDEPWDSDHNRQFHGEDVPFYRCPSDPAAQTGQTTYSVVVGPDMPFEAGEGKRLADFGPHSDDMILLVERARPVCWMAPAQEVPQSAAEQGSHRHGSQSRPAPSNSIGSHHPYGAIFGLRNGAAEFLSYSMDLEAFNQMLRGTHEDRYRSY